jgi:hypothetical protein
MLLFSILPSLWFYCNIYKMNEELGGNFSSSRIPTVLVEYGTVLIMMTA